MAGNHVLIHTDILSNDRTHRAGREGLALYIAGLCYAARAWSGGYIPNSAIPALLTQSGVGPRAIAIIVNVGLWESSDDGYEISRARYSPRWRLGHNVDPTTQGERKTREYRAWRTAVLARDNDQCAMCPATTGLHVHHVKDFALYPDLRLDPDNGITLCVDCHSAEHGRRVG